MNVSWTFVGFFSPKPKQEPPPFFFFLFFLKILCNNYSPVLGNKGKYTAWPCLIKHNFDMLTASYDDHFSYKKN